MGTDNRHAKDLPDYTNQERDNEVAQTEHRHRPKKAYPQELNFLDIHQNDTYL